MSDPSNTCKALTPEAKLYFRNELQRAVAQAQRDAEGFQEILYVIERLGVTLSGKIQDLGKYQACIQKLASQSAWDQSRTAGLSKGQMPFDDLYTLVRNARNDALHSGAVARHITSSAILLALILEDALITGTATVREFMVQNPVCAYLWQPVSLARQQMLANSFSYLPIQDNGDEKPAQWKLLADFQIAKYLSQACEDNLKLLLAKTIGDACSANEIELEIPKLCRMNQTIQEIRKDCTNLPVLVVDDENHLIGILTPFDLL